MDTRRRDDYPDLSNLIMLIVTIAGAALAIPVAGFILRCFYELFMYGWRALA